MTVCLSQGVGSGLVSLLLLVSLLASAVRAHFNGDPRLVSATDSRSVAIVQSYTGRCAPLLAFVVCVRMLISFNAPALIISNVQLVFL